MFINIYLLFDFNSRYSERNKQPKKDSKSKSKTKNKKTVFRYDRVDSGNRKATTRGGRERRETPNTDQDARPTDRPLVLRELILRRAPSCAAMRTAPSRHTNSRGDRLFANNRELLQIVLKTPGEFYEINFRGN